MKAFKSVALSTLLVAGTLAYQKPAHAEDPRIPLLVDTYVINQAYLLQNPENTDAVNNSNYALTAIFEILDSYTQFVSLDSNNCPIALSNYSYILFAQYRQNGAYVRNIIDNPRFLEQRTLTTVNYCGFDSLDEPT